MRTVNQRRFVQACLRYHIPYRIYDGPPATGQAGTYLPTYYVDTNGMTCIVESESVWTSQVSISEACQQLPNFYIMTKWNLALVERGRFRFVPLEVDLARALLIAQINEVLSELTQDLRVQDLEELRARQDETG